MCGASQRGTAIDAALIRHLLCARHLPGASKAHKSPEHLLCAKPHGKGSGKEAMPIRRLLCARHDAEAGPREAIATCSSAALPGPGTSLTGSTQPAVPGNPTPAPGPGAAPHSSYRRLLCAQTLWTTVPPRVPTVCRVPQGAWKPVDPARQWSLTGTELGLRQGKAPQLRHLLCAGAFEKQEVPTLYSWALY